MSYKFEKLGHGARILGAIQESIIIGFLEFEESESFEGHEVFKLLGDTDDGIVEIQYVGKPVIPSISIIIPDITDKTFNNCEIVITLNDEDDNNLFFANLVNTPEGWQVIYYKNIFQNVLIKQLQANDPDESKYLEEIRIILVEIYNQLFDQIPKE